MSSSSRLRENCVAPGSTEKSVLVVSDLNDPGFNSMLLTDLTSSGWAVECVPDNITALDAVIKRPFDLVITAAVTSAKEDVQLLRHIRGVRSHARMIILTNDSTPRDVVAALKERAFSYFSRPFPFDALARMIQMAMKGPCWDDGIELASATPEWMRLWVRCDGATADRMLQYFDELVDLPEEDKNKVAFAFREMLVNAMNHGAHFDPTQYVEISYLRAQRAIACRVKDPGQGFAFDELLHAAVSNPGDNPIRHMQHREALGLPPGGYGILLSRHLVDELIHNEQGNEVLLVKYLDRETGEQLH